MMDKTEIIKLSYQGREFDLSFPSVVEEGCDLALSLDILEYLTIPVLSCGSKVINGDWEVYSIFSRPGPMMVEFSGKVSTPNGPLRFDLKVDVAREFTSTVETLCTWFYVEEPGSLRVSYLTSKFNINSGSKITYDVEPVDGDYLDSAYFNEDEVRLYIQTALDFGDSRIKPVKTTSISVGTGQIATCSPLHLLLPYYTKICPDIKQLDYVRRSDSHLQSLTVRYTKTDGEVESHLALFFGTQVNYITQVIFQIAVITRDFNLTSPILQISYHGQLKGLPEFEKMFKENLLYISKVYEILILIR